MMYDVVIIGSGPAGLSAAIYSSRARLKTLVMESADPLSQLSYADRIDNYPGFPGGIAGSELCSAMKKQAEGFGAVFLQAPAESIDAFKAGGTSAWRVRSLDKTFDSYSIIVATGARWKKLGVKGESEFLGKGVSYCATCDGPFFKDKNIAVIGGGNSALEEALYLTRFAKNVMIIHRRDKLRADRILQDKAMASAKIKIIWNANVVDIQGKNRLESIKIKDTLKGDEKKISCDGVFISVGFVPNTDFVKGFIKLTKAGYIITDKKMACSKNGIFACGDCRDTYMRQVITACGDGAFASLSCRLYIDELKARADK